LSGCLPLEETVDKRLHISSRCSLLYICDPGSHESMHFKGIFTTIDNINGQMINKEFSSFQARNPDRQDAGFCM
jgi:hypothetical protein